MSHDDIQTSAADDMPMSMADYYRSLRLLIEQDVESGVSFAPRIDTAELAPSVRSPQDVPQTTQNSTQTADVEVPTTEALPAINFPSSTSAQDRLDVVAQMAGVCQRCGLCEQRTNAVPGEGSPQAELVFVGEGPGADEDASGRPFVGAAGQLLDRMIQAMGFERSQVYICNAVKCRPPQNRNPQAGELYACQPYLVEQLQAIKPKVICSLGAVALRVLLGDEKAGISRNRGKELQWQGIPLVATFHPAYLLRNPSSKGDAWTDLKRVVTMMGRSLPARK